MKEVWKPINEFYDVSSLGRVRSWYIRGCRYAEKSNKSKILKLSLSGRNYHHVAVHNSGSVQTKRVHRLVMEAFHGPSKLEVNHKNGIKADNRLVNLEYVTHRKNMKHAAENGFMQSGLARHNAKLTDKRALEIFHAKGFHKDIAEKYGISQTLVSGIKRKTRWKHIHKGG